MGQGRSKVTYASLFRRNDLDLVPRKVWRASLSKDSQIFLVRVAPGKETLSLPGLDPSAVEAIDAYMSRARQKS